MPLWYGLGQLSVLERLSGCRRLHKDFASGVSLKRIGEGVTTQLGELCVNMKKKQLRLLAFRGPCSIVIYSYYPFKTRINSHLLFAGIIRSLPFSPR